MSTSTINDKFHTKNGFGPDDPKNEIIKIFLIFIKPTVYLSIFMFSLFVVSEFTNVLFS